MTMCISQTRSTMLLCMDMLPRDTIDYDAVSDQVRRFCAERLYELERGLRPLVDGSFGEILPGHLNGYLTCLKELGKLYEVHKRPHELSQLVPMAKVEAVIAGIREQHERELVEAVAAAEERARIELASGQQLSIKAAKSTVLARLHDLERRAS
jgi:hypothetical protein